MTTTKSIAVSALALGSLLVGAAGIQAHETGTPIVLEEAHGKTLTIGSKRTVVYFLTRGGQCQTTFVVADAPTSDGLASQVSNPTRFSVEIAPGKVFRMAGGTGYALSFKCSEQANALHVKPVAEVAYKM
ncbi:MAG: hypothetical protein AAFO75_03680 [Pseudomonadota bacterium]